MTAGLLIGPAGLNLVEPTTLLQTFPLLATGLGWIGLMVGLQLRRDVVLALPTSVRHLVAMDIVVSVVLFGGAATAMLYWWWRDRAGASVHEGIVLVLAASVGWAMETRSLHSDGGGPAQERLSIAIRAGGSLAAVIAITIFGLGAVATGGSLSAGDLAAPGWLIAPGLCAVLAIFMGVAGRFMLGLAGKHTAEQLAVFLGVVAFVAGIATELGVSALFAALMTGAVMANLKGVDLRRFERFILAAEHALAVIFAMVAGVLLDPMIGWTGFGVVLVLVGLRQTAKPGAVRFALRTQRATTDQPARGEVPARSRLYGGAARQSPIAMIMAVGLVLSHPTESSRELLTVVVLTGLLCQLVTMVRRVPAPSVAESAPVALETSPTVDGEGAQ